MRAVTQKFSTFNAISSNFGQRAADFIIGFFQKTSNSLIAEKSRHNFKNSIRLADHSSPHLAILKYGRIISCLKDIDPHQFSEIELNYPSIFSEAYVKEIELFINQVRDNLTRKYHDDQYRTNYTHCSIFKQFFRYKQLRQLQLDIL